MKQDVYQKVTDKIIADLEQGELTWLKPWSSDNMDGRIVKPLRHNGMPYSGINVLMLWGAAIDGGFVEAQKWGISARPGNHPAVISFATYQKIQERLHAPTYAPARKDVSRDFPLRGADPPPLKWSAVMVKKMEEPHGEQATEAGRDCLEVAAG